MTELEEYNLLKEKYYTTLLTMAHNDCLHMKKKIYIINMLLLCFVKMNAQDVFPIHDRNPHFPKIETPNAASFNKFIDNPISLYTGTPDICITLFNLIDGVINLPISLRYNTSGIKVREEASWVGLGWNLNVGGVITKNTVGKADEVDDGSYYRKLLKYLIFSDMKFYSYYGSPYTLEMHNDLFEMLYNSTRISTIMGQLNPDVYYFSYPGGGGKFIFDHRDNKIYLLDRENGIQIIGGKDFYADGFDIVTEEGIEHFFRRKFSISDGTNSLVSASINYTLDYSIYPNGQRVDYTYTTVPYRTSISGESYQRITDNNESPNSSAAIEALSNHSIGPSTLLEGTDFVLTGIQTTNYQVKFITSMREDIRNGLKLDNIIIEPKVKNANSTSQKLAFKYDYFIGKEEEGTTALTPQSLYYRLKLNSIYYLDKSNLKTDNRYDFYYEKEDPPYKHSRAVDYWGYYNGQIENKTLLPNLEYLYYGLKSSNGYKDIIRMTNNTFVYKATRASEERFTKAGILKGIKYPTGGYKEFEYELNTFVDYFIPTITEIENEIFVKDNIVDRNNSADKKSSSFILEEDSEVTFDITVARGLNNWYDIGKHSFKIFQIKNGVRELCKSFNCNSECFTYYIDSNPAGMIKQSIVIPLSRGSYIVEADLPDALGDQAQFNSNHGELRASYFFSKPIKTNESKGGGLRIKNITSYNDIDKKEKLLSTDYVYVKEGTTASSGILHEKLRFHQLDECLYAIMHGNGVPIAGFEQRWVARIEQLAIESDNYISNPYRSVPSVGYSTVKEIRNNGVAQGYTIHSFINKEPMVSQNSIRLDDPLNGKLSDLKVYDKNDKLIKQEKYHYSSMPYHYYYGINLIYKLNMYPSLFTNSPYTPLPVDPPSLALTENAKLLLVNQFFEIKSHALNSIDIYLDKKELFIDGITTTETYTYNSVTHQLKERKTTLNNGSILKRAYSYANDFVFMDWESSYIYTRMANENRLSDVVEEKVFYNNRYLGGSLTLYDFTSSYFIYPSRRYFSEINTDETNPVTYNKSGINADVYPLANVEYKKHDIYSNPIYIVHNKAFDLIYLWSYNGQYPIAEIKNATYDQVLAAVKAVFGIVDIDALSQMDNPSAEKIESLRTDSSLASAHVTTFTYTPLLGVRTATDAKGITTFYDYDDFGRLKEVYIKENGLKKIIESNVYNLFNK